MADAKKDNLVELFQMVTVLQGNMAEQTRVAIEEYAKLGRAQVDYGLTLSKNMQQLVLSQTRLANDLFGKFSTAAG